MTCEQARERFVDYWRGALGESEDEFHAHLDACERCRAEAADLRDLWGTLSLVPEEDPSVRMRMRFYDSLRAWGREESGRRHVPALWQHPAFQAVAAALILAIGIGAGYFGRGREASHEVSQDSSEISQLRGEVYNMRQLVALSLLQQQNASDRLRGVSYAYRVEQGDPQVLSALLTTVNHDPNVNVRLAAVDALRNFSASPTARQGLEQALHAQDAPLVQISILDQIVEMRDKSALAAVQAVAADPNANAEVRQHAQWALKQIQ